MRFPAIRGRVIPALAISLVVVLLGVMGWSLLGPKSPDTTANGRINAPGVFIPFSTQRTAPDFTVTDFDTGKKVSLSDFKGKTVVINFWASWCPPCQTEAPLINTYVNQTASSDVAVIGIAIWDLSSASQTFVQQYALSYPNGADSKGSIAIDYGVAGVPETFVVSPEGKLIGKFPGAVETSDQLTNALKESAGG
ncbi:MAG: TlpA disulfide reductase family protein [Nitrolancea sp.]